MNPAILLHGVDSRKYTLKLIINARVQGTTYIGRTFEKDFKGPSPRKTYKYLGIEEIHDIQHTKEK